MSERVAIVLAAGQGTRMKSPRAKVLHEVAGWPLVAWPIEAARRAGVDRQVVVVGHDRDAVIAALAERFDDAVTTAVQQEQRGTGHAVQCAMETLPDLAGRVLILYGDCPLLSADTLRALLELADAHPGPLAMLTMRLPDPTGYGRIVRGAGGEAIAIREHRDCAPDERAIDEVNPGVYCVDAAFLRESIAALGTDNAQGELYLTDVVAMAAERGGAATLLGDADELRGVNDRYELSLADGLLRGRLLERLARGGVTIRDPRSTHVDAGCVVEPGAVIEPGVHLRGRCRIAAGARIDVGCVLTDVDVAPGAWLKPYTVAEDSRVGPDAQVGPFSHLRPATELGPDTRVGNFVETKKTTMGRGSKANHLAYVGDGVIGEGVNIGAGTIFCNYDGVQKHTTTLEDGVFIGSDSQLVAPVTVGKGAYVASGTTVTRDVPADALAVGRAKQDNKEGYAARLRKRFAAQKRRKDEGSR